MRLILLLGLLSPQDTPKPRGEKWLLRHEALVAQAKAGGIDVLFLGDSITEGWGSTGKSVWQKEFAPLKAANFGIGGDSTQHVLWRIQNGEMEGIRPRVVVLLIGTNNLDAGHSPERIAKGVRTIVDEISNKSPQTRILLLGIFPRGEKPNPFRGKIREINGILAKMSDEKKIRVIDIGDRFVQSDGTISREIMSDFLHLTPKGYRMWADAIREPLAKLMESK